MSGRTLGGAARIVGLGAGLLLLVSTAVHAGAAGPPYDAAATTQQCSGFVNIFTQLAGIETTSCPTSVSAEKQSGAVSVDAQLIGVDAFAQARADATVLALRTIRRAAASVPFTVTFKVDSAELSHSGTVDGSCRALTFDGCFFRGDWVALTISVRHAYCDGCVIEQACPGGRCSGDSGRSFGWTLLPYQYPEASPTGDFTFALTLINPRSDAVPAGPLEISAGISAVASLGVVDVGEARAAGSGFVTSIELG